MPTPKTKGGSALKEVTIIRLYDTKILHFILHNYFVTTMEFVVHLLTTVFRKSQPAAQEIMLTVHRKGCATVGTYTYDVAYTRKSKALNMAKNAGYPLKITMEEAN